ncbi:peptidylprolyl isomerase [Cyanobium sp. NIES-981]|uniref:peptidylprolyl isomerase n=1 Tax=Cyanobium sp. NIES-981 TaxID=1851505 RepID=UPI0007DD5703|nr:peptidylprolyl isomerase [Cyanobium sp. NIES-981]SBO44339.1 Parvulin-like peptidyl-prolyl isomerase [Cyanobium sp. NIES-981]
MTTSPSSSTSTPRTNLPEPLSGLPEPAVVELGRGLPWLTLEETNRLIRQQGLAKAVARAWILDELVRAIPLDPEQERQLIRSWVEQQGVKDEEALDRWLLEQRLHRRDLRVLASQAERLRRFQQHRWHDEVEVHYLRRKPDLDQVVYSLLRVQDQTLAEELHQRIAEGEAEFADLASRHSEGQERKSRGLIGPVSLAASHAELSRRLRLGQPGQVWPPFRVAQFWVVLRLEEHLPARLNGETRSRMMGELFEAWLQERVQLLLAGEPLPPLPPMPAASEPLIPPGEPRR